MENINIVEIFFNEISLIDGFSIVKKNNGAQIIPPKSKYFYMPRIIVHDLDKLRSSLQKYSLTILKSNIKSAKIDRRHNLNYFLGCLTKNLTNSDCNNLEEYVDIYSQYISDDTFSTCDEKVKLGQLDDENYLAIKRSQEYYGMETPYIFKINIENRDIKCELPIIRYGVYTNNKGLKVARIYSVQRKKIYKETDNFIKINKMLSAINSSVKTDRDLAPSMIVALATFIGLLQNEGIYDIEIADYIPRRYAHFKNVKTDEQRDRIQTSATDKFLRLFRRLNWHFEDFNIWAYPNDIDSYMHISFNNKLECNNELLEKFYLLGYNGLKKDQDVKKKINIINNK